MDQHIFQLVAQYGALGILIWLVHHIFAKLLPDTLAKLQSELQTQRSLFISELRTQRQEIIDALTKLTQAIEQPSQNANPLPSKRR